MRRIALLTLFVAAVLACAGTAAVQAKIIYVDDDAPAPGDGTSWPTAYRFLQDALTDAVAAEKPVEIHVAQGLYKPDRNQFAPEGTRDTWAAFQLADGMSLVGGYGGIGAVDPGARDFQAYEAILSGDLAGNDAEVTDATLLRDDPTRAENSWQVVVFRKEGTIRLEGCTITGGTGGGAYISVAPREARCDVTVSDCRFYGNRGSTGDAITMGALGSWLSTPKLTVVRCSFVGNAGWVGALDALDGVVKNCRFERNYSWGELGGAVWLSGDGTITDCTFTENIARRAGGALRVRSSSAGITKVLWCVFRHNFSGGAGGAIICEDDVDIASCVFVGNVATTQGGACVHSDGDAFVTKCVFAGNRAGDVGGAWISGWRSSLEVVNCTAFGNDSDEGRFLAVNLFSEEPTSPFCVRNSILLDGSDEIWSNDVPVEVSYCCLGQDMEAAKESDDWLASGPGNISADPCFVDTGYWDANGTPDDPNDDFFVEGDYHLKSQAGRWDEASGSWVQDDVTSPCIDAGDPNSPVGDEPLPNGGVINMGAYGGTAEASMSPTQGPTAGQWTEPIPLYEINTDTAEEWSPVLSPDGLTLYFGREMRGDRSTRDIWVSYRLGTGE